MDNYVMYLQASNGSPIKTLTETLKEVITDTNIHFDKDGFTTSNMDPDKKVHYVTLKIYNDKFEKYYCSEPISIGVDMIFLSKLLKVIKNGDSIVMYILHNNRGILYIEISNTEKNSVNTIAYGLSDIDIEHFELPEIKYDIDVIISCHDFQTYCKNLSIIDDELTIYIKNNAIIFSVRDNTNGTSQTIKIEEDVKNALKIKTNNNYDKEVKIGSYSLSKLNLFNKSTSLCQHIKLSLSENTPLKIVYSVSSLGYISFYLTTFVRYDT